MKISTVIALVVSAAISTSTVSAQPREERGGRVDLREHRVRRPPPPVHHEGDWVNLATPTPTSHGTEYINVGREAGAYRALRIDLVSGVVNVRSIRVVFGNGQVTTFYVGRRLDRRHPRTTVQFSVPRRIQQIAITTARRPAGTYAVFGSWGLTPAHEHVASN